MQQLLFNPLGNDTKEARQIWFGNTTNTIDLNNTKYTWATELWHKMRENFWTSEKVDLTSDVTDYQRLTPSEVRAFDGILGLLIFLDSEQVSNIPNIIRVITAPELKLPLGEQIAQENLHAQCYDVVVRTVIPPEKRDYINNYWKHDDILLNRCKLIANQFQNYIDNSTPENYFKSLFADYILEGLYFYQAFAFFYNLASRQLMSGTADMIKLINRDELSHVRLYQKLVIEGMQAFTYNIDWIYNFVSKAVEADIKWNKHIIGNNILGMTYNSIEQYTYFLANARLKAIGLKPLYDNVENPYTHLEKLADTKGEASVKANFFESGVTSYMMSSGVSGWEEI